MAKTPVYVPTTRSRSCVHRDEIQCTHTAATSLQEQWKRKKQTKEQARAAKRGRLDPDSALNRNAKEVLDERARSKRKAEDMDEESSKDNEEGDDDDDDDHGIEEALQGIEREQPLQGLKKRKAAEDEPHKKARLAEPQPDAEVEAVPEKLSAHQEKKLSKKLNKSEKRADKKKNKTEKPAKKFTKTLEEDGADGTLQEDATLQDEVTSTKEEDEEDEEDTPKKKDMRPIDISGLADDEDANRSSQSSTPASPTFDSLAAETHPSAESASTTTSITSEAAGAGTSERPSSSSKKLKVPADTTELRARLTARIAALRAARKADGPDGTPIRTRAELIESRRKKEAERKAHKKELRRQAKEAEDKKREEALASARNSPMLSFGSSPGSPEQENNFSFGRVAFADGTQMSQDLSYVKDKSGRKKGPTDPKGALAKMEAQKRRLATLDADKRKEVLEKETWLAARRRAEGEKVRDDETLLKKAVKRKEKTKKKSEREWADRSEGVKTAQKQKQARREKNLRERKEAKMAGKAGRKGKGKSPSKKKSRPGFEGSGFGGKRK